jgi:hypothetical protein
MNQYQYASANSNGVHAAKNPRSTVQYIKCDDIQYDTSFAGQVVIYEDGVSGDYTYPGYFLTPAQIYIGRKLRT